MKFVKENSYEISKLFVNQIGISIFALCLTSAGEALKFERDTTLRVSLFVSLFSLVFFSVLLYLAAWEMGSKDKVNVDCKKAVLSNKRGWLLAICASFPQLLVSFLGLLSIGIHYATKIGFFSSFSSICNILLRFGSTQYIGVLQLIIDAFSGDHVLYLFLSSLGYLLLTIIPISVTVLGYGFGIRNKTFSSYFTKKDVKP